MSTSERARMPNNTEPTVYWIHFTLMPGHEYPIPWVPAQKNLLPVGVVPGTSRTEVRLTNHLASRTDGLQASLYTCVTVNSNSLVDWLSVRAQAEKLFTAFSWIRACAVWFQSVIPRRFGYCNRTFFRWYALFGIFGTLTHHLTLDSTYNLNK